MKSVTCFINSLAGGGAEHQLIILANLLVEKGYKVSFVTYNESDDGQYHLDSRIRHISIRVKGGRLRKMLKVFTFLLKHETDCFISFRAPVNFILLWPMLFRRNVKVIVGERNLTIGKPSLFECINFSLLYKRANFIVPNSVSQTDYILSKKPIFKNKLVTIQNYTEIDKYLPAPSPNGKTVIFGVFCRYAEQKNYKKLAKAVKILKDRGCRDFLFKWYGKAFYADGSVNPCYTDFKNIITTLDINEFIVLNDIVTDVSNTMGFVDAICLPSLYEGFSNSLSEAICSAKPVVASDVSDNKIMVKEGFNGFLFTPTDSLSMANAFQKMLELPIEKRKNMGNNSRTLAESLFDKAEFVNSYIRLIED